MTHLKRLCHNLVEGAAYRHHALTRESSDSYCVHCTASPLQLGYLRPKKLIIDILMLEYFIFAQCGVSLSSIREKIRSWISKLTVTSQNPSIIYNGYDAVFGTPNF